MLYASPCADYIIERRHPPTTPETQPKGKLFICHRRGVSAGTVELTYYTHACVYYVYITCVLCRWLFVCAFVCVYIYVEKRRCCLCREGVAKMKGMGGVSFSGAPLTAATRRVRDRTGTVMCVPRGRRAEFSPVSSGSEFPRIQSFRPRDTTPVCMHIYYIYKCKYYNARVYRVY